MAWTTTVAGAARPGYVTTATQTPFCPTCGHLLTWCVCPGVGNPSRDHTDCPLCQGKKGWALCPACEEKDEFAERTWDSPRRRGGRKEKK